MQIPKKPRYEYAKHVGRDFIKSLHIHSYPIDPIDIIYRMDWRLEIDDLCGEEGYTFYNTRNKQYCIVIDNGQNVSKQRCKFTIAHEIGHILMKHYTTFARNTLDDHAYRVLDIEANVVAGELLMPYLSIHKNPDKSIDFLAQKYDVSYGAMVTRLKFLGLHHLYEGTNDTSVACEHISSYHT
ncbi:ImmA/IrrE family metallo-endopeptidase [Vallitalea pronyensis]|uniref:ImmA/IrrE family metallo-endopeptidase n=1 Tax=Vallitalea pronyensis TaxID=1348613 RepID=A0A8J8SJC7_9FIRM|nr:ImmA/IrrE family metallo-endopeptidase [Vallitalea pronyensis]QUI25526.1 ImmA/IrrE family metallo-endopeptidase [Vallitalea pronyensis]